MTEIQVIIAMRSLSSNASSFLLTKLVREKIGVPIFFKDVTNERMKGYRKPLIKSKSITKTTNYLNEGCKRDSLI